MQSHQHLKPEKKLHWFEEKISNLYSRSLFLRKDEVKALQESAKLLDQQTASIFLLQGDESSGNRPLSDTNLKKLIESLRRLQSNRESDSRVLARLREDCLAFRKAQIKKGFIKRIKDFFLKKTTEKRILQLQNAALKIDLDTAELRQQVSMQFLALMIADRSQYVQKNDSQDQVEKLFQFLNSIRNMRKINHSYKKIYLNKTKKQTDRVVKYD